MKHDPQIQITEQYTTTMVAPEVEVLAWWSLSNVDRYRFVETDPARGILEYETGFRRYDTKFGAVTEQLPEPTIPPVVRTELTDAGYSLAQTGTATHE